MGQAKQRKAEIAALKASKTNIRFFAVRHCENGEKEFAHAEVTLGKPVNGKNELLRHICLNDWLHNPPVEHIAEYLVQTNTYKMFSQFNNSDAKGFVINFYEVDEEYSRQVGQKAHSAREIMAMPVEAVKDYAEKVSAELKATGEYSVKEYA